MSWDTLIKNGLVFDGRGGAPVECDVAIEDGKIAAIGEDLDAGRAAEVIDATGRWVIPGLWDIHTHLDLEVELDPSLSEVVRHGTTTAVVANCSIGVPFGRQNDDGHDPVVSCFARVENIPKSVLRRVAERITWDNPKDYLAHFAEMPLGANVVPMIPHSMLRIEAMGLERAISEEPTEEDLQKMERILEQAMSDGYLGFSTDMLPVPLPLERPAPREANPGEPRFIRRGEAHDQHRPQTRPRLAGDPREGQAPQRDSVVHAQQRSAFRKAAQGHSRCGARRGDQSLACQARRRDDPDHQLTAGKRAVQAPGARGTVSRVCRWDDHPARGGAASAPRAQRDRPRGQRRAYGAPERPGVLQALPQDVVPRQEGRLAGASQALAQHDGRQLQP